MSKDFEGFDEAARVMIKWMCDNCHPHTTVIVTCVGAELVEGVKCTGPVHDYLKG